MFCKNCGTKNHQEAKFCANCGTSMTPNVEMQHPEENHPVVKDSRSERENPVVLTEVEKDLVGKGSFFEEPVNKKKGSKKIFSIIAIICVLAVGGFFLINTGKSTLDAILTPISSPSSVFFLSSTMGR